MFQKKLLQTVFNMVAGANFEVSYWDGETEVYENGEPGAKPEFRLILKEKLDLNEIRKNPQLKLGEAYIRGDIDLEGSLKEVLKLAARNAVRLQDEADNDFSSNFWQRQQETPQEEQQQGVRHHYDLGNNFFRLWQDETMTYSCAYFKSRDDSLKQAQQQKIDHILNKLNLEPGDKLLDIGCGWGSLALRAAGQYDVEVLGITLSQEQVEGARKRVEQEGLTDRITIRKQDFRDLVDKGLDFDKVVSVGMFEHVGKEHIPEYFQAVDSLLKKGGLSLLHTITHLKEKPSNPWLEKYIFPWGYIPSLREVVWQLPEYSFHLLDVEDIGFHYSLTAENWYDNFEQVTDRVSQQFDEEFVRMWRLFLAGVVATFQYFDTSVHQLLFSSGKNIELPLTRDYIYN